MEKESPASKLIALRYVSKLMYLIFWYSNMYAKSVKRPETETIF